MTPEQSLLLLCARREMDGAGAKSIGEIAARGVDWDALLAAAAEHCVAPLVFQRLLEHGGEALSAAWRERFRGEFARNAKRNLFLTAELFRVLAALETAGVRATPYKGPVAAMQAYGDIALRQFADLDVVAPQKEIAAAHRSLTALGFQPEIPGLADGEWQRTIPGQYAYAGPAGSHVELHTEATLRYMPRRLDLAGLLGRRETIDVAGKPVATFSLEDTAVLLAVHGSKHFWDRLGWIADIAGIAQGPRRLDWGATQARAEEVGARRMLLLAAGLAFELFGATLPESVHAALARDAGARELKDRVVRRFFAGHATEPGVVSRMTFRMGMGGGRVAGLLYALRLATAPTETDRRENPAAEHFEPLHAILRPLRLARQYGWRTRTPDAKQKEKASAEPPP